MPTAINQLKILHVAEILKGGTASYIDELLAFQGLSFGSENIHALLPQSQIGYITHLGSNAIESFEDESSRLIKIFKIRKKLQQLFDKHTFDVIHIHGTFAGLAIRFFFGWKFKRPKFVYCAHGWAFDRESAAWKNWIIGQVEKFLSYVTDIIICISDHDYQSAIRIGIPTKKLITIKNAIASDFVAEGDVDWPPGKRRFLFAGRFDKQKGMDLFVKAMRQIGDEGFAYAIGDESVGDIAITNLPENIKITGWLTRNEVQTYIKSCEVFVMPSRWEGFGLSALEAMRAGRLVIATRVGGLPELIVDKVSGVLIEPNSVDDLVKAMREISHEEVIEMGKASRQRFESFFTSDKLNVAIIDLYKKLIGA
jgi:glycosyltransferase involved in cell wall biosynthesis